MEVSGNHYVLAISEPPLDLSSQRLEERELVLVVPVIDGPAIGT
jgi:hypothetical protein